MAYQGNNSDLTSSSQVLAKIANELDGEEQGAMVDFRAARLWLQYLDMVAIIRRFIKAECTGNWMLNLAAVQDKLPFLQLQGIICRLCQIC